MDVSQRTAVEFHIRSCGYAQLELRSKPDDGGDAAYQITIGTEGPTTNASKSIVKIRDANNIEILSEEFDTPDIIDCEIYRRRWLSWQGGVIQVRLHEGCMAM